MDIPARLSVKDMDTREFPWEWCNRLVISLNGVERDKVISYDIPARTLTRLATDENGELIIEGEDLKTETLTGDISVHLKD